MDSKRIEMEVWQRQVDAFVGMPWLQLFRLVGYLGLYLVLRPLFRLLGWLRSRRARQAELDAEIAQAIASGNTETARRLIVRRAVIGAIYGAQDR